MTDGGVMQATSLNWPCQHPSSWPNQIEISIKISCGIIKNWLRSVTTGNLEQDQRDGGNISLSVCEQIWEMFDNWHVVLSTVCSVPGDCLIIVEVWPLQMGNWETVSRWFCHRKYVGIRKIPSPVKYKGNVLNLFFCCFFLLRASCTVQLLYVRKIL